MLELCVYLHVPSGARRHAAKLGQDHVRHCARRQRGDEHARLLQNALLDQLGRVLREAQEDLDEHADANVVRDELAYVGEGLGARAPHAVHVVFGQPHKGRHEPLKQLVLAAHLAHKVKVERRGLAHAKHGVLGQGHDFGDDELLAQVEAQHLCQQVEQLGGRHAPLLLVVFVRQAENDGEHVLAQVVGLDELGNLHQRRHGRLPHLGLFVFQ